MRQGAAGDCFLGRPGTASLRGHMRAQASRRLWNPPNSLMRERPLPST